MGRRFIDAPNAVRCAAVVKLKDGTTADCGRRATHGTLCTQHAKIQTAKTTRMRAPFEYYINLDERGEFSADVRKPGTDETVFEINGFSIFEDGFMRHNEDMDGLADHLRDLAIIGADDSIRFMA